MKPKALGVIGQFLQRYILTRENLWVLIISFMLLLLILGLSATEQPRFMYIGF